MKLRAFITMMGFALLVGCSSGPAPRTFVLRTPATATDGVRVESGQPILELKQVSVPDYLDTTDILIRNGRNELIVSPTARWGERLSIGMTHALAGALASRLPAMTVVSTPVQRQTVRLVMVDIDAFDVFPDGRCVVIARWTTETSDRRAPATVERGSVTTRAVDGLSDAAIVAAMVDAIEKLADHIALTVSRAAGSR